MPRPFITSLDAGVAEALAGMRIREGHTEARAHRELDRTLTGLVEAGQIDEARKEEIAGYFDRNGVFADAEKWTSTQRRLDDHSRTSSKNRQWQDAEPFASQLDAQLTPKRRATAARVYSGAAKQAFLKEFGAPGIAFFEFYADLRRVELGAEPPQPLTERLDEVVVALTTSRGRKNGSFPPSLMNRIYQHVQDLKGLFSMLSGNRTEDAQRWSEIGTKYRDLVMEVAERQGIHLAEAPHTQSKSPSVRKRAWADLHMMTPTAVAMKQLREQHPELYEQKQFQREAYAKIEERIVDRILDEGMVPSKARILGKVVHLGTRGTQAYVFEPSLAEGEKAPTVKAWSRQRMRDLKAMSRLAKAERLAGADPKKLKSVTFKRLKELEKEQPEPEFVALTDDAAKQNGQTRVVPTRWVETEQGQQRVVVDGRFKGVLVDDLINSQGRMLEGTAFRLAPSKKRGVMVPTRVNPSKYEPYISVAEVKRGKRKVQMMAVELPGSQGKSATTLRRTMRKLSKAIPDVKYAEGSLNRRFYFEPRYFEAVREALGGSVLLSPGANDVLGAYFDDLTKLNAAMASDNLDFYTAEAIGGFRKQITTPGGKRSTLNFHAVQQRILARLEANGNRGVVGLGTGGGKTLIAIAMMQKLIRDGVQAAPDNNGRFLYVCPEGHTGNVRNEVRKFLKNKDAEFLLRHLDIVEYPEFSRAERSNELDGKPFEPSDYVSVIFDEAQALKNEKWVATKSAYRVNHPRKILMTASVMDKADPREVYNLVQIANNVNMTDPSEARAHWADRRKFEQRYASRVGGVVVGPTADEVARQEYEAWVNKNVQYIDKTAIPEAPLPPLTRETVRVKMHPSIEREYKKKLHGLKVPMRGAITLHADGGKVKGRPDLNRSAKDQRTRRLLNGGQSRRVGFLDTLANTPWQVYSRHGELSPKIEAAIEVVAQRLEASDSQSRSVIFHEKDREMLLRTGQRMSEEFPGKIQVVALRKEIRMFRDGEELDSYGPFSLPFTAQAYRPDPNAEESADNPQYEESEWRQFVLDNVIKLDPNVLTVAAEAQQYGTGLNMQHAFDTVMHFDRVDAEKMNQRLGRVWRHGQIDPVKEFTFDVRLSGRRNKYYTTLDEMRREVQENQDRIFQDLIIKPQEVQLGAEWSDMEHQPASMTGLKQSIIDLLATPAAEGIRRPAFLDESGPKQPAGDED